MDLSHIFFAVLVWILKYNFLKPLASLFHVKIWKLRRLQYLSQKLHFVSKVYTIKIIIRLVIELPVLSVHHKFSWKTKNDFRSFTFINQSEKFRRKNQETKTNILIGLKFMHNSVVLHESIWWAAKLKTYEKTNKKHSYLISPLFSSICWIWNPVIEKKTYWHNFWTQELVGITVRFKLFFCFFSFFRKEGILF